MSDQENTNSPEQILDVLIAFFREDDWPFDQIDDEPVLRMGFQGENGRWTCFAQAREEQKQYAFFSIAPVNAPPERRMAMAEFLTRANFGLVIGNFEMDFEDGEIRYKTSVDVEGDRLSPALIRSVTYANVLVMDQYLPGIMSVIYTDRSPVEAITLVEG